MEDWRTVAAMEDWRTVAAMEDWRTVRGDGNESSPYQPGILLLW